MPHVMYSKYCMQFIGSVAMAIRHVPHNTQCHSYNFRFCHILSSNSQNTGQDTCFIEDDTYGMEETLLTASIIS